MLDNDWISKHQKKKSLILSCWLFIGNVLVLIRGDQEWSMPEVTVDCHWEWLSLAQEQHFCWHINGIKHWPVVVDHMLEMFWWSEVIRSDQTKKYIYYIYNCRLWLPMAWEQYLSQYMCKGDQTPFSSCWSHFYIGNVYIGPDQRWSGVIDCRNNC